MNESEMLSIINLELKGAKIWFSLNHNVLSVYR